MPERAEVLNAADPAQVKRADRRDRDRRADYLSAVKAVLGTPAGRTMCWGLLERAGVFQSVWHSSALIHYNAGRQDFGHALMALFIEADEEAYQLMESEARARMKRDAAGTDAAHTPRAGEPQESTDGR